MAAEHPGIEPNGHRSDDAAAGGWRTHRGRPCSLGHDRLPIARILDAPGPVRFPSDSGNPSRCSGSPSRCSLVTAPAVSGLTSTQAVPGRHRERSIVGLVLDDIAVDGCITKAPGGGEVAGPVPGRPAQTGHETVGAGRGLRHPAGPGAGRGATGTTPRCWPPPWTGSDDLGPLPDEITVHLDAGYDSGKTRETLADRGLHGRDRPQGREGADPGQPALARRAHQRLAQRLQPAPTLLRTPREGDRRVLRPRRRDHHRP